MILLESHPDLEVCALVATFPRVLASCPSPDWLCSLLRLEASAPLAPDVPVRAAVRDALRRGGFKPTGRSKPASEYLVRAAVAGQLASINAAVDACNAASLHSGLPMSVIDLDLVRLPLRIAVAAEGASYPFNASGQVIELAGLACLIDADGPCANAVKDAQRTKTRPETTRTLSIVWGARALGDRAERTLTWYRELLERLGAPTSVEEVRR
jgi:DNA/RNA-binding domain of Phe-tRNA-synthetase-like protein